MECPNCKQLVEDDSSFCSYCGNKFEKQDTIEEKDNAKPNVFTWIIIGILVINLCFILIVIFPSWVILSVLLLFGATLKAYCSFVIGVLLY